MNALYDIIGIPFGYLMKLISYVCSNYAISIIIFTVVTKILLFPVNYKTQKNAARMQLLNPKLEKLKKAMPIIRRDFRKNSRNFTFRKALIQWEAACRRLFRCSCFSEFSTLSINRLHIF